MRVRSTRKHGFSIVEVVVTLLIMGIVGSVAFAGYQLWLANAQTSEAREILSKFTTDIQGVAIADDRGSLSVDDLTAVVSSLNASTGQAFTLTDSPSTSYGELSADTQTLAGTDGGVAVSVAMLSRSGECVRISTSLAGRAPDDGLVVETFSPSDTNQCVGDATESTPGDASESSGPPVLGEVVCLPGVASVTVRWELLRGAASEFKIQPFEMEVIRLDGLAREYTATNLQDSVDTELSFTIIPVVDGVDAESVTVTCPAVVDSLPPTSPANLVAKPDTRDEVPAIGERRVRLTWSPSVDAELAGYRVLRNGVPIATVSPGTASFEDNNDNVGLAPGTYTYQVQAFDGANNTASSNFDDGTSFDLTPPPPPQTLTAEGGAGSVALSWAAVVDPDVAGYRLAFCVGVGCTNFRTLSEFSPSVTSWVHQGLAPNTSYSYALVTFDDSKNESAPAQASAVTTSLPAVPVVRGDAIDSYQVKWSWEPASGAESYSYQYVDPQGPLTETTTREVVSPRTGPGTDLSLRVGACNISGCSWAEPVSVRTIPVPPIPQVSASVSGPAVRWDWDFTAATSYYNLRGASNTSYSIGRSFTLQQSTPGTLYSLEVQACNVSNLCSDWGQASIVTIPAPPALNGNVLGTTVTLSWVSPQSATSFVVERRVGSGQFTQLTQTSNESLVDSALALATIYTYQVRACNATGCSSPSEARFFPTLSVTPTLSGSLAGSEMRLSWSGATAGPVSHTLQRSVDNGSFENLHSSTSQNGSSSFTDTDITPGSLYEYRVNTCNAAGCTPWSTAVSTTARPPAPELAAYPLGQGAFLVVGQVSGATSYVVERRTQGTTPIVAYNGLWQESIEDRALNPATIYSYRAQACNSGGCSPWSPFANVTTVPAPPRLSGSYADGSVALSWTGAAAGFSLHYLQRQVGSSWTTVFSEFTDASSGSFTDANLTAGTTYTYRAYMCDGSGCGAFSNLISITTPPPPPSPTAAGGVRQVRVSWLPVFGASFYSVREFEGATLSANVQQNSFTHTGLPNGATYRYEVRACNTTGCSTWAPTNTAETLPDPSIPTLSGELVNNAMFLSWDGTTTGAVTHELERKMNDGGWANIYTFENSSGSNSFTDTQLLPGTEHSYRARFCDVVACTAWSNVVSALTVPTPSLLDGTVTGVDISVSWPALPFETTYTLERAVQDSSFRVVYDGPHIATFNDPARELATSYSYRIRTCNPAGCSGFSESLTLSTLPTTPSLSGALSTASTASLSWTLQRAGAVTHTLQRTTDGGPWETVRTLTTTTDALSFTNTNLSPGSSYDYRVQSCNQAGCTEWSNTVTLLTVPLAPSPTATGGAQQTFVSWAPVKGASFYAVRIFNNASLLADSLVTNAFTHNSLAFSTTYRYEVRACNATGCSSWAATQPISTLPDPSIPTLTGTVNGTTASLAWTGSTPSPVNQVLQRRVDGGEWLTVNTVEGTGVGFFTDSGLANGTPHSYRAQYCDATNACSLWSNVVTLLTTPAPPEIIAAGGARQVILSWEPPKSASSYNVRSFSSPVNIADGVAVPAFTVTDLLPDTPYRYEVQACNASGCSPWVASNTVSTLAASSTPILSGTITDLTVSLSWEGRPVGTVTQQLQQRRDSGDWVDISTVSSDSPTGNFAATLDRGLPYSFRVRYCGAECTVWSNEVSFITTPSPVTISATATGITATAAWTQSPGATRYELQRQIDSRGFNTVYNGPWLAAWDDFTLAAASSYGYRVRACNGPTTQSCSAVSATARVATLPTTPALAGTLTGSSMALSWTLTQGSTVTHTLQRQTVDGSWGTIRTQNTSATSSNTVRTSSFTDSNLTAGTVFNYRVQSCNQAGCTPWSNTVSTLTAPAPPVVTVTPQVRQLNVSWPAVPGATFYTLRLAGSPDTLAPVLLTPGFTHTNLENGAAYAYEVRACNTTGCSIWTRTATTSTLADPSSPLLSGSLSGANVSLSWTGTTSGSVRHSVERRDPQGLWTVLTPPFTTASGTASFVDTTALPGTSYSYRTAYCDSVGCSGWSNIVTLLTTPATPSPTATPGLRQVTVSWPLVSGDVSYTVRIAGSTSVLASDITFDSFIHSGLANGTAYAYEVRACNAAGCSPWASTDTVATLPAADVPTLSGSFSDSVSLSWIGVTVGVMRQEVERRVGAGLWQRLYSVESASPGGSLTDTDVSPGESYSYRVRYCDAVCGSWSNVLSGTTTPSPTTITAVPSGTSTTLSFPAVTGGATYRIDRQIDRLGFNPIYNGPWQESVTDSGLLTAASYGYRIRVCNQALSCSAVSPTIRVTTAPATPELTGQLSGSSIPLAWTSTFNSDRFVDDTTLTHFVQRQINSGSFNEIFTVTTKSPASFRFTDQNLAAGSIYNYRVQVCNQAGCSGWSNTLSTTPAPPTPLPAATPGIRQVSISWPAVPAASWYRVRDAGGVLLTDALLAPGFTHSGLLNEAPYRYEVQACNSTGGCSAWGSTQWVTTLKDPTIPTLTAQGRETSVFLEWDGSPVGDVYVELYRRVTGSDWEQQPFHIGDWVSNGRGDFNDEELSPSTSFEYRMRYCNEQLCGSWSNTATAQTAPAPPTPSGIGGIRQVTVTWNPVPLATFYTVRLADTTTPLSGSVTTNSYIHGGLPNDTEFTYEVRACNSSGCSPWAAVGPVRTLAAAQTPFLQGELVDDTVELRWLGSSENAVSHTLQRRVDQGSWELLSSFPLTTDDTGSFIDTVQDPGTPYSYRVQYCTQSNVCTPWSNTVAITTIPPPTTLTVTVNQTQASVAWVTAKGATRYEIQRFDAAGEPTVVFSGGFQQLITDSQLPRASTFTYRVWACNQAGCSTESQPVEITTIPTVPQVSLVASEGGVTVSWTLSRAGTVSHTVQRRESGGDWATITSLQSASNALIHVDTSAALGTLYDYRVQACNMAGCTDWSTTASILTTPAVPSPTATGGVRQVSLGWPSVFGATSYDLRLSGELLLLGSTPDTSFTHGGLPNNATRVYQVRACNAAGCSPWATTAPATTLPPPSTPTLTATLSDDAANLSWTGSTNGTVTHQVDRRVGAEQWEPLTSFTSPNSSASHTDTPLAPGTTYSYRVRVCDAVDCSLWSQTSSILTPPSSPLPVAAGGIREVDVSWSSVQGATYYTVRSFNSASNLVEYLGPTSFTVQGLENGEAYRFEVRACNATGCSAWAATEQVSTAVAPGAPTLTVVVDDPTIRLRWQASSQASAVHEVQRQDATTPGGSWVTIRQDRYPPGEVSFDDPDANPGSRYLYRVRFRDDVATSEWSNVASAELRPTSPPSVTATATGTTVAVSWEPSWGASRYTVEKRTGSSGSFATLADTNSLATSDSGLLVGSLYEYRVTACNQAGCSAPSSIAQATTIPANPVLSGSTTSLSSLSLTWVSSPRSGAVSYAVQRQVAGVWTEIAATSSASTTTTLTLADLPAGNEFVLRVQACNQAGCVLSNTITLFTPPSPPVLSGSVDQTLVALSWSGGGQASSYTVQRRPATGAFTQVATSPAAQFSEVVPAASAFTYRVQACNQGGCGEFSNELTLHSIPTTPTLTAALSGLTANLSWRLQTASETTHTVQRQVGSETWVDVQQFQSSSTSLSFADLSLAAGTRFTYRVQACNTAGCTPWATAPSLLTAPATPQPSATGGTKAVTVSWAPVQGVEFYKIRRQNSSTTLSDRLLQTTYTQSNLADGTSYRYEVQACNTGSSGQQCSPWGLSNTATTLAVPQRPAVSMQCDPFAGQVVVAGSGQCAASWSSSGATRYNVRFWNASCTNVITCQPSFQTTTSALSLAGPSFSGQLGPTPNVVGVQGCNAAGCGEWETRGAVSYPAPPLPRVTPFGCGWPAADGNSCLWEVQGAWATSFEVAFEQGRNGIINCPSGCFGANVPGLWTSQFYFAGLSRTVHVMACPESTTGSCAATFTTKAHPNFWTYGRLGRVAVQSTNFHYCRPPGPGIPPTERCAAPVVVDQ